MRSWYLKLEPHVAIRAKRWFAKIDTYQFGSLKLSATPENCRDLEIFIERYPLLVQPSELLKERANEHRERQSLIEGLLNGTTERKSFDLKIKAREYQSLAAQVWLTAHGLLLADDLGTGKTISALCGLTEPATLPALVVTLTHLPIQWEEQIHKFTNLTTHILRKGTPYDILKYTDGKFPDVIISNYHKLSGWSETIAAGLVRSIILDEAHELRHRTSQKYAAAKHIAESVDYRIALTATPIVNYGGEIFNVIDVVCPGQLGTWEEFSREWCTFTHGDKPRIKDPAAFGLYARETGLMLRRTRKDVNRELPKMIPVIQKVESDTKALDNLKGQAIELAKLILKQGQDFKGQKMQAAGEFDLRMRQATGIGKAPHVADFVRLIVESNDEPVILFGWHREVYSIWMERLKDLNPVMYTGSESPAQKEEAKRKFLSGESKVMIISLRAGQGMDGLQDVCHVCVFGELDWANIHTQCVGRVYRDGQTESVVAYYLISDHGSDPIICDILGIKTQQLEGIINPNTEESAELATGSEQQEQYIQRLAQEYLQKQGIELDTKLEVIETQ